MRAIALLGVGLGVMAGSYALSAPPAETLDRILAGRTAGPPVSCVSLRNLGGNRSVEGAIVFGGDTHRIYVNQPPQPCPSLANGRSLIVHTPTGQLCRGDIARVADLTSGSEIGACGLGDFTPYDRPSRR
jgi:hypothetical protein